jgi:rhodanese-related sulfurtransferase
MRPVSLFVPIVGLLFTLLPVHAENVSLGTVFQGEETAFQLSCANSGKQPIWAVDATSSCDCLVGRFAPVQVAPGDTARLRFAYRSDAAGRFSITVQLRGREAADVFGTSTVTGFVADKTWLVPAAQLIGSGQAQPAVIVDTRSPERYAQAHIPRSLNLPAYAIRSRRDLRDRRVVLMDEGYSPDLLLELVAALRHEGFAQLFVLDGGIAHWGRQGGAMEGIGSAPLALAALSAADFVRTDAGCDWRIVEVGSRTGSSGTAASMAVTKVDRWEDLAEALPALSQASFGRVPPRILVIAPDQATCARIEARLGARNPAPIYYLTGGRTALDTFLRERAALAANNHSTVQIRPSRGTPVVAGGCNTCPSRR